MINANYKISTEYDGKTRKLYAKRCKGCDVEFWSPRHLLAERQFCSTGCSSDFRRIKKVSVICDWCGKEFGRFPLKVGVGKTGLNFCNRKCKDEAQKIGGRSELALPHYRAGLSNYRNVLSENSVCVGCEEPRRYLLRVHHIDGDRTNNIRANLEIVCGTCHDLRHLKLVGGKWYFDSHVLTPRECLTQV